MGKRLKKTSARIWIYMAKFFFELKNDAHGLLVASDACVAAELVL